MSNPIQVEEGGALADAQHRWPEPSVLATDLQQLPADARLERIHLLLLWLVTCDELQRLRYRNTLADDAKLISRGDWRSMFAAARKEVEEKRRAEPANGKECPYLVQNGCLYLPDPAGGTVLLARFVPRVIAETTRDDGAEVTKHVRVLLTLPTGRAVEADVPAESLHRAREWTLRALGPAAVINPQARDELHVATAAQYLGDYQWESAKVFAHTGWRSDLGEGWRYLTASGALGDDGLDETVTVDLGNERLNFYALPDPPEPGSAELAAAVRASLDVLAVAPASVTVPILAAAYRAPLPLPPETSVFVVGPSGSLKTAVSALACQHFGSHLDAKGLPAEWKSTSNSLEAIAYQLANVLLVIDDYAPQAADDPRKLATAADRIFRGAANASGRGRTRPDGTQRPSKHPRSQVLSTGEDVPPGESLRARLTITNVERGAVDLAKLTEAQSRAASGVFTMAMAGYVRWLAARLNTEPGFVDSLRQQMAERRGELATGNGHMRVPEAAAGLLVAWRMWMEYATSVQAATKQQATQIMRKVKTAIVSGMAVQSEHTRQMKVEEIYVGALATALVSGSAHFADRSTDREPLNAESWGWEPYAGGSMASEQWHPRGSRIGWVDRETQDVFLHPQSAFEVAIVHAKRAGTPLNTSKSGVHKHLQEAGYLKSVTGTGGADAHLTINKRMGGSGRRVLHIHAHLVTGAEAEDEGAK